MNPVVAQHKAAKVKTAEICGLLCRGARYAPIVLKLKFKIVGTEKDINESAIIPQLKPCTNNYSLSLAQTIERRT